MDWNDDAIARLRALWDEGHSTAEIGRRMSVSKNAVVGKAHRLNLPARPSPIRRDSNAGAVRSPAPKRISGPTLPPLPAAVEQPVVVSVPELQHFEPVRSVIPARPAPSPVLRAIVPRSRTLTCCWPIGDPGTKNFRFCDSEATHGKPYCGEHAQLAYVKVRERREEVAA